MTHTHPSMSHEGKETLRQIVEGLGGVTSGPWSTINNGNEYWLMHETGCMQTGYECAFNREDARHIARCHPDAIRAIAEYAASLEAELSTARRAALLEAANAADVVASIASGTSRYTASRIAATIRAKAEEA